MSENILKSRLLHAAKPLHTVYDLDGVTVLEEGWDIVSTYPKVGEVCLEIISAADESDPDTYKIKIGDNAHTYMQLPYFGSVINASGNSPLVVGSYTYPDSSTSGSLAGKTVLRVYRLVLSATTTNGVTTVTLDVNELSNYYEIRPGTDMVFSASTGYISINPNYDALDVADSDSVYFTEWDDTNKQIKIYKANEDHGIISRGELYETIDATDIAPIQSIVGGTKITVNTSSNTATVNHDDITVKTGGDSTKSSGIKTRLDNTEKETDVVTDIVIDAQGHVVETKIDKSSNLVAADIKAPVTQDDNTTWNDRVTGGTINIGEDIASIPVLKGKTVVWNQVTSPSSVFDLWTGARVSSCTFNANTHSYLVTFSTTDYFSLQLQLPFLPTGNVILISCDISLSVNSNRGTIRFGRGNTDKTLINSMSANTIQHVIGIDKMNNGTDTTSSRFIFNSVDTQVTSGTTFTCSNLKIIDLTKMFGRDEAICTALGVGSLTGDELTLAAQNFEKMFPQPYYGYCEGKLMNVGGYGIKWNQLAKYFSSDNYTSLSSSTVSYSDGIVSITANSEYGGIRDNRSSNFVWEAKHKYLISIDVLSSFTTDSLFQISSNNGYFRIGVCSSSSNTWTKVASIVTNSTSDTTILFWDRRNSDFDQIQFKNFILLDLTLMFGAGNEPTVEEFEAMFPEDYYEYDAGSDVNIMEQMGERLEIESVGFNQWDEEWENGTIDSNGQNANDGGAWIRSKNYIQIVKGLTYYAKCASNSTMYVFFYDESKNFIYGVSGYDQYNRLAVVNTTFTTPDNARYIRFHMAAIYGTIYNHDICINLSDSSRNGTYLPYKKDVLDLGWVNDVDIEWNVWDEQWEVGTLNNENGNPIPSPTNNQIRSKNFCKLIGAITYMARISNSRIRMFFYDASYNYISSEAPSASTGGEIPAPSNAVYFKLGTGAGYGTTYNHDICISKSVPAFNGTYLPYGERLKVFPEGLCSAGSVYDEARGNKVIKRVGCVDLGELSGYLLRTESTPYILGNPTISFPYKKIESGIANFVNNKYIDFGQVGGISDVRSDAPEGSLSLLTGSTDYLYIKDSSITASDIDEGRVSKLKGLTLYYELATPFELDLENPQKMDYLVDDLGRETQLPLNTSYPVNAPFVGTFEYKSNFKDTVIDLINRVNAYTNPVRSKDNVDQTEGKFAVYDSKETVRSSDYSVWTSTIDPSRTDNNILLPSIDILIDYVNNVISSALTYKGTIDEWSDLPTSGQSVGDMYIASTTFTHSTVTYNAGDFFIWNGSSWDVVQGTTSVTDGNITLAMNGTQQTVATIDGQPIHITSPQITTSNVSGLNTSSYSLNGTSHGSYTATANDDMTFFAPVTGGTSGDILVSSGNSAPVWSSLEANIGKKTLGYTLTGNGTGENDDLPSWRKLTSMDLTSSNLEGLLRWNGSAWEDLNFGTDTGYLERYLDTASSSYQWRLSTPLTTVYDFTFKNSGDTVNVFDPDSAASYVDISMTHSDGTETTQSTSSSAGIKMTNGTNTYYQKISFAAIMDDTPTTQGSEAVTIILNGNFS